MNADEKRPKPLPVALPDEDDWSPRRGTEVREPAQPKSKAKALVRRPPQPTITDLSGHTSAGGETLRPPGAVPPPPRGVPRSVPDEKGEAELDGPVTASVGSIALLQRAAGHRPSSSLRRFTGSPAAQKNGTDTDPTAASLAHGVAAKSGDEAAQTAAHAESSSRAAELEVVPRQTLPSPAVASSERASPSDDLSIANAKRPDPSEFAATDDLAEPSRASGAAVSSRAAHATSAMHTDDAAVSSRAAHSIGADNREGATDDAAVSSRAAYARSALGSARKRIWLGLLVVACVSVALGVGISLLRRPAAAPSPRIAPSSAPVMKRVVACAPTKPARRIAPTILMSISPLASDGLIEGRILLGFAENPTTAVGLAIDPDDLDIAIPYREQGEQRVVSVTPYDADGQQRFFDWREREGLRKGRLVNASVDFALGLSDSGFVRQPLGGSVETIWPLETQVAVTDPRVASLPERGHAVAFRQGGQAGTMMLGWLTENGQAMAGPHPLSSSASVLGTPTIAANAQTALLAFAGKSGEPGTWSIYLSRASYGQPPQPATVLELPPGGPGGDAIAPALTQVVQDHWLLQWSEGPPGQRQVRVQTLDQMGHPLGMAHTVSPAGSNSGQGLLWSSESRAVSMFIVSSGKSAELWATSVTCKP